MLLGHRGGFWGYLCALVVASPLACSDGESEPGTGGSGSGGALSGGQGGTAPSPSGGKAEGGAATGGRMSTGGSVSSVGGSSAGAGDGGAFEGGGPGSSGGPGDGGTSGAGGAGGDGGDGGASDSSGSGTGGAPLVPTFTVGCPVRLGGQSGAGGDDGAGGVPGDGNGNGGGSAGGEGGGLVEDESGSSFVTTDLNQGVPVALNERGQVVATVTRPSACHSFLVDEQGVRDIAVAGEHTCTRVNDINDAGFVVGTVDTPPQAFLWHEGVATLLNGVSGNPVAINNSNQVVFDSGLLWEAGQVTTLTVPGGERMKPTAMNNAGQVVGVTNATSAPAYLWQAGIVVELPISSPSVINDRGHILCLNGFNELGIWDGTRFLQRDMGLLPIGVRMGMNNADEIAATVDWIDFAPVPVVISGSHFTELRGSAAAFGINDRGDVIGQLYEAVPGDPRLDLGFRPTDGIIWSRTCSLACCP